MKERTLSRQGWYAAKQRHRPERLLPVDGATHLDEPLRKIKLAIRLEWEWIFEWGYAERRVPIHVARQGWVQLRAGGRITGMRVHSSSLGKSDRRVDLVSWII